VFPSLAKPKRLYIKQLFVLVRVTLIQRDFAPCSYGSYHRRRRRTEFVLIKFLGHTGARDPSEAGLHLWGVCRGAPQPQEYQEPKTCRPQPQSPVALRFGKWGYFLSGNYPFIVGIVSCKIPAKEVDTDYAEIHHPRVQQKLSRRRRLLGTTKKASLPRRQHLREVSAGNQVSPRRWP
jgi:hypothetical protein